MRVPTVEIEFTEDTFGPDGDIRRNQGERALVDKVSAHSFCDIKKVARRVADGQPPQRKEADDELVEGDDERDRS